MTSRRSPSSTQRLPGNDGAWFLKAVGVDDSVTDLSDVDGDASNTSELVQELWEADGQRIDVAWTPGELDPTVQRNRSFRWPMVFLGVLLLVGAVLGALWLPGTSVRRANTVAIEYETALGSMLNSLPAAQQTLAALTEPTADVSQFAAELDSITALRTNADDAMTLASDPLPTPWPLAPKAPLEELAPFRDSLARQGASTESIARRLAAVLEYRMAAEGFLVIPVLPTEPGEDLAALSEQLATVAADSATALTEMPDDPALVGHKAASQELLERFTTWQVAYVDALRNDDTDQAEILVTEMQTARAELDTLMMEALAEIRSSVDEGIISLASTLEETIGELVSTGGIA